MLCQGLPLWQRSLQNCIQQTPVPPTQEAHKLRTFDRSYETPD
jgi:hypothetical protein